jgi:hypothetical protein
VRITEKVWSLTSESTVVCLDLIVMDLSLLIVNRSVLTYPDVPVSTSTPTTVFVSPLKHLVISDNRIELGRSENSF